jgi:formylmethanofuran dehydrogenase subunit B
MTNSIAEIADADFILTTGTNTTEGHPVIGIQIKKALRKGATLAVIDPRKTEIAELANYHLRIKSGTDIALLNGLANVIIAEGLWDKEFVQERTEDFEAFKASVAKYTPEYVEEITGVPAETIKEVARGYAKAKSASILYTMGLTQHVCGTHNVFAVANLTMLCGQIGKASSGVNPLRGQNNVQGACDMGALPAFFTAYQPVAAEANRAKFAAAWGVEEVPAKPGLTVGEIIEQAGEAIKAIYIMGENPVLSDPDADHVIHSLESLDFLVVQDIFLTETAQLADVVLPAASFAEKDGTFSNTERRVQLVRKAFNGVQEGCFFAADKGARAGLDFNPEAEVGTQDIISHDAVLFGLGDGQVETADGQRILSPAVDISFVGADGQTGNHHTFQNRVGIPFQDTAVHECARVAFVGVTYGIFLLSGGVVNKLPFISCGEAAAAPAPQAGLLDFIDNGLTLHFEALFNGFVPAGCNILFNTFRVGPPETRGYRTHLLLIIGGLFHNIDTL